MPGRRIGRQKRSCSRSRSQSPVDEFGRRKQIEVEVEAGVAVQLRLIFQVPNQIPVFLLRLRLPPLTHPSHLRKNNLSS